MKQFFLATFASAALFAQTPPAKLEFEVASIKPSPPISSGTRVDVGVHIDGALLRCSAFSLRDFIRMAYHVKDYQIIGPDWLTSERFDINAKMPEGAGRAQVADMIQTLLASRFHMKVHRDQKDLPVYALVVAKGGLKMKEDPPDPGTDGAAPGKGALNVTASGGPNGASFNLGNGATFSAADNKFEGRKLSMPAFVDTVWRFMDRPVIDMTELSGTYDFTLEFSPEDFRAMRIRSAITAGVQLPPQAMQYAATGDDAIATALQTIGLKLESRKAPVEVIVIDEMDKMPTDN